MLEHAQMQLYRTQPVLRAAIHSHQERVLGTLDEFDKRHLFDAWLEKSGHSPDEVLLEHFQGRYGNAYLVFDLEGRYIDYFFDTEDHPDAGAASGKNDAETGGAVGN